MEGENSLPTSEKILGQDVVSNVTLNDYVQIVQDGCYKLIPVTEFLKNLTLGGIDVCGAFLNCAEGMGCVGDEEPNVNQIPVMNDVYVSLANRTMNYNFSTEQFVSQWYDAENDEFKRIVILEGSNLRGVTFNGLPVYIGQIIYDNEIPMLQFDSPDTDASAQQIIYFDAYDNNNVKAI